VLANFGSIFFNQLAGMLLSLKRVVHTISINTVQALSKLLMVAFIFYFGWVSGAGILLVYLALPLIILPAASLLLPDWYRFGIKLNPSSWLTMRSMALNSWVASFGSVLIQNADIVLVGMLLTPIETGLMGAASRLAIFIALIGGSLVSVLGARVSTYQSEHDLNAYWKKALLIFVSAGALAIISFVVSKPLIQLTVGGEYLAAAPVLSWLLAASWLAVGLAPLSVLFYSYDKPWYFSVSVALQTILLLAGNYVLLPPFGIIAAGWVRLGSQLVIVMFTIGLALYTHRQKFQRLPILL
jgi:O-antigen/teichoic acid export membrane protein